MVYNYTYVNGENLNSDEKIIMPISQSDLTQAIIAMKEDLFRHGVEELPFTARKNNRMEGSLFEICLKTADKVVLSDPNASLQHSYKKLQLIQQALDSLKKKPDNQKKLDRLDQIDAYLLELRLDIDDIKRGNRARPNGRSLEELRRESAKNVANFGRVKDASYQFFNQVARGDARARLENDQGNNQVAREEKIPEVMPGPLCYSLNNLPLRRQYVPNACTDETTMLLVDFHRKNLQDLLASGDLTEQQQKIVEASLKAIQSVHLQINPAYWGGRDVADFPKIYSVSDIPLNVTKEDPEKFKEVMMDYLYERGPLTACLKTKFQSHTVLIVGIDEKNVQYADVWDGKVKEMPLEVFTNRFNDPNNAVGAIQGAIPYSFKTLQDFLEEQRLEAGSGNSPGVG